ncbi:MAG: peptidylprolyl isomerase [Chromatiaceae bacterium]|nr:peptidylprolyl isomerase [Chromatiaceae bacterium]
MKKTPLSLLLCALLATSGGLVLAEDTTTSPETLIATVNGTDYRLDVFRQFYLERLQQTPGGNSPEAQERIFDEFMNLVVTSQEAAKRNLEGSREVQAALELQRIKVLSSAALTLMAEELEPSEKELRETYDQLVAQAAERTEYKARHILVKDEAEAKKLIKQLDKGADFAELAREHSLGPTGKNGGDLDWFDAGKMVPPFAEAVAALKPGTYTKSPVQTQFGWHIIELEETRSPTPPSFEDAKPQITNLVKRQQIAERIAEMRNNAKIDPNEDVVKIIEVEQ